MKTYYVLMFEDVREFYYFKIIKGTSAKNVEDRLRSCGYKVSRAFTVEGLKKTKMDGKEKFLERKNKNVGMWDAIQSVDLREPIKKIGGLKANMVVFDEVNGK